MLSIPFDVSSRLSSFVAVLFVSPSNLPTRHHEDQTTGTGSVKLYSSIQRNDKDSPGHW